MSLLSHAKRSKIEFATYINSSQKNRHSLLYARLEFSLMLQLGTAVEKTTGLNLLISESKCIWISPGFCCLHGNCSSNTNPTEQQIFWFIRCIFNKIIGKSTHDAHWRQVRTNLALVKRCTQSPKICVVISLLNANSYRISAVGVPHKLATRVHVRKGPAEVALSGKLKRY